MEVTQGFGSVAAEPAEPFFPGLGTRKECFTSVHLGQRVLNQLFWKNSVPLFSQQPASSFSLPARAVMNHFLINDKGRRTFQDVLLRAEPPADIIGEFLPHEQIQPGGTLQTSRGVSGRSHRSAEELKDFLEQPFLYCS